MNRTGIVNMIFGNVIVRHYVTLVLIMFAVMMVAAAAATKQKKKCQNDRSLAMYAVTFHGNWQRNVFPKHFPEYRPPAQFGKTFGECNLIFPV